MRMMRLMHRAIFKKYWKTLLCMVLISAVGCGTMTAIFSATLSLEDTFQEYLDTYGIPDATITTAITKKDKMEAVLALQDVAEADTDCQYGDPGGFRAVLQRPGHVL